MLPKILIIDDQLGRIPGARDSLKTRSRWCRTRGVRDVTGDHEAVVVKKPVADAVFYSSQVVQDSIVENRPMDEILAFIRKGWNDKDRWALLFLDLQFLTGPVSENGAVLGRPEDSEPGNYFGLRILQALRKDGELHDLPVVILSSMNRSMVELLFSGLGVCQFVEKNSLNATLLSSIIFKHGFYAYPGIIGRSKKILLSLRDLRREAFLTDGNLLLLGETGTGKELFARALHDMSERRDKPFIVINSGGLTETLVESTLFGHKRGAFTGAIADEPGAFKSADGGTVFLDEIGDISAKVQVQLLRVLQDKTILPLGSSTSVKVNVRIVAATNQKLEIMVKKGLFRQDLFYRLNAACITLPPLRERGYDLTLLVNSFIEKYEVGDFRREVTDETWRTLYSYSWPGNVRELENIIERAVRIYTGIRFMHPTHLPEYIVHRENKLEDVPEASAAANVLPRLETLDFLLEAVRSFSFSGLSREMILKRSEAVEEAGAVLMARYLEKVLQETADQKGKPNFTRAVKLMHAGTKADTTACKQWIRKILGPAAFKHNPSVRAMLLKSEVLASAAVFAGLTTDDIS